MVVEGIDVGESSRAATNTSSATRSNLFIVVLLSFMLSLLLLLLHLLRLIFLRVAMQGNAKCNEKSVFACFFVESLMKFLTVDGAGCLCLTPCDLSSKKHE